MKKFINSLPKFTRVRQSRRNSTVSSTLSNPRAFGRYDSGMIPLPSATSIVDVAEGRRLRSKAE
jgi:hypothetical protein